MAWQYPVHTCHVICDWICEYVYFRRFNGCLPWEFNTRYSFARHNVYCCAFSYCNGSFCFSGNVLWCISLVPENVWKIYEQHHGLYPFLGYVCGGLSYFLAHAL